MQECPSIRFGKRLRELREARNWTQEKAAEACGIGYKLYQLYELGIKTNPGLLTLEKLARGFELHVSELLARRLPKMDRSVRHSGKKVTARKANRTRHRRSVTDAH